MALCLSLLRVPAHPILASAFTQGAPAAQDFPSFHQGPLSFNLLPFQRKGNRILSLVFPIPDVSSRKDRLTGAVATLLKTQQDSNTMPSTRGQAGTEEGWDRKQRPPGVTLSQPRVPRLLNAAQPRL